MVDRKGALTHVKCSGVPPQMFRERIGVVVEGTLSRAGHFEGHRLMVSHGNEYQAPSEAEGAAIDELMRSVREGDGRTGGPRRRRFTRSPVAAVTAALGRNLVLLALLASTIGAVVGGATAARGSALGWTWTRRLAYLFAATMVAANGLMVWALLARDFSISYVAQVGLARGAELGRRW